MNARAVRLPGGLRRLRPFKNESTQRIRVGQSSVDLLDSLDVLDDESFDIALAGERHTGLHWHSFLALLDVTLAIAIHLCLLPF